MIGVFDSGIGGLTVTAAFGDDPAHLIQAGSVVTSFIPPLPARR